MKRLVFGVILVSLVFSATARADDFDRAVEQVRQGIEQQNAAQVMDGLERASVAAWKKLPFTVVNVHLVAAPPEGYGRFIPRVDNVYRPGEPLIIYLEPVGFKVVKEKGEPAYKYSLSADFNLVDAWGMVVGGRRGFGQFQDTSRVFPNRLPLTFTYSLAGLPPGSYKVETILHDKLGKKSHSVVTKIRITGN